MLVYNLSELPMMIASEMVDRYKKGTKPQHDVTQSELDAIRSLLFETINQTKADYNSKVFKNYREYPTSSGFIIKNAEDAMAYNYYHEGMHLGVMMTIRKFV